MWRTHQNCYSYFSSCRIGQRASNDYYRGIT